MIRALTAAAVLLTVTVTTCAADWARGIPGASAGPVASDRAVYVAGGKFSAAGGYVQVTALTTNGTTAWQTNVTVPLGVAMPTANTVQIAAGPTGVLMALGESFAVWLDRGGAVRHTWPVNGVSRRAVVTADGTFAIISTDSGVAVFDVLSGQPLWWKRVPAAQDEPPVVAVTETMSKLRVIALQGDNAVHAYALRNGDHLWSRSAPPHSGPFSGIVTASNGLVSVSAVTMNNVTYTYTSTAYALAVEDGRVMSTMTGGVSVDPGADTATLSDNGKYLMMGSVGVDQGSYFFDVLRKTVVPAGALFDHNVGTCTPVAAHPSAVACPVIAQDLGNVELAVVGPKGSTRTKCSSCFLTKPVVSATHWFSLNFDGTVGTVRGISYVAPAE